MNDQQAGEIHHLAKQLESTDLSPSISTAYPNEKNLEQVKLSVMLLSEFMALSKKVFAILSEQTVSRANYLTLPAKHYTADLGDMPVHTQMTNYLANVTSASFVAAEVNLLFLIQYLRTYNIYDRAGKQQAGLADQLQTIAAGLELQQQNINTIRADAQKVFETLQKTNEEIQAFTIQKKDELTSITTNLQTANTQTAQINDLLNKATESNTRIATLLETQQDNKRAFDTAVADLQKKYTETSAALDQSVTTANAQIVEFTHQTQTHLGQIEFVESKKAFFEERINYLQALIGREVGASLFETFKQRKTELKAPLTFWRWAVPAMAVGTIFWISYLFSHQPITPSINEWWEAFAVNSLKTIPAILLLLFAINQYRKERNFQEEYAFKSAVALTIDAYAGRLQDPANKDKLIMDAVFSVYKTPIEDVRSKIKNKTILDMAKSVVETAKGLKGDSK